jgi:hypothetical protein
LAQDSSAQAFTALRGMDSHGQPESEAGQVGEASHAAIDAIVAESQPVASLQSFYGSNVSRQSFDARQHHDTGPEVLPSQ